MHLSSWLPLVLSLVAASSASPKPDLKLPVVDLGYELHQAITLNKSTDTYTFSNIRYAQAPVGNLRFRAPLPPLSNRDQVQNGSQPRLCPQASPKFQAKVNKPIAAFFGGKPYSLKSWEDDITNASAPPPMDMNTGTTEDCLFLDVHVPRKVFETNKNANAPVLVWIHGGGYVLGSKTGFPTPSYDPSGLLNNAKQFDDEGIIFVAINYRLGALGWLPGPEVQMDGDLNAGFLDQRLALKWVQDNIDLFGGSPDRVTVLGQSAGGASALLHMVGSADVKAPFAQVISQSPALSPLADASESVYKGFISKLNVTTLAEARKLPSEAVIKANVAQVGSAPPTTYVYGPALDPKTIPEPLSKLLGKGAFDKSVKVLVGHNPFEGGYYFDPNVKTDEEFYDWIQSSILGITDVGKDYLTKELYPLKFDSHLGYVDQPTRQMALWGDAVFNCNYLDINKAFNGNSYSYLFNITPGAHTQDLKYTFNDPAAPAFRPIAQKILQTAITSFTIKGQPVVNEDGSETVFPLWGAEKTLLSINSDGVSSTTDAVNETRCAWWASARGY